MFWEILLIPGVILVVGIIICITEERKIDKELKESDKEIEFRKKERK